MPPHKIKNQEFEIPKGCNFQFLIPNYHEREKL